MSERAEPLERELTDLPPARRPLKAAALAVMAVTAALALWLAYGLRSEAIFALSGAEATEVGALASADLGPHEGGFVRATVDLREAPTATFSRPFEPVDYRMSLVAEGQGGAQRWVVYPVSPSVAGPRFEPPTLVAGRLERVGDLGVRFRGLAGHLGALSASPTPEAWVVVDGEDPTNMAWVLALEVLLLAFAAFNLASIARIARRVR